MSEFTESIVADPPAASDDRFVPHVEKGDSQDAPMVVVTSAVMHSESRDPASIPLPSPITDEEGLPEANTAQSPTSSDNSSASRFVLVTPGSETGTIGPEGTFFPTGPNSDGIRIYVKQATTDEVTQATAQDAEQLADQLEEELEVVGSAAALQASLAEAMAEGRSLPASAVLLDGPAVAVFPPRMFLHTSLNGMTASLVNSPAETETGAPFTARPGLSDGEVVEESREAPPSLHESDSSSETENDGNVQTDDETEVEAHGGHAASPRRARSPLPEQQQPRRKSTLKQSVYQFLSSTLGAAADNLLPGDQAHQHRPSHSFRQERAPSPYRETSSRSHRHRAPSPLPHVAKEYRHRHRDGRHPRSRSLSPLPPLRRHQRDVSPAMPTRRSGEKRQHLAPSPEAPRRRGVSPRRALSPQPFPRSQARRGASSVPPTGRGNYMRQSPPMGRPSSTRPGPQHYQAEFIGAPSQPEVFFRQMAPPKRVIPELPDAGTARRSALPALPQMMGAAHVPKLSSGELLAQIHRRIARDPTFVYTLRGIVAEHDDFIEQRRFDEPPRRPQGPVGRPGRPAPPPPRQPIESGRLRHVQRDQWASEEDSDWEERRDFERAEMMMMRRDKRRNGVVHRHRQVVAREHRDAVPKMGRREVEKRSAMRISDGLLHQERAFIARKVPYMDDFGVDILTDSNAADQEVTYRPTRNETKKQKKQDRMSASLPALAGRFRDSIPLSVPFTAAGLAAPKQPMRLRSFHLPALASPARLAAQRQAPVEFAVPASAPRAPKERKEEHSHQGKAGPARRSGDEQRGPLIRSQTMGPMRTSERKVKSRGWESEGPVAGGKGKKRSEKRGEAFGVAAFDFDDFN